MVQVKTEGRHTGGKDDGALGTDSGDLSLVSTSGGGEEVAESDGLGLSVLKGGFDVGNLAGLNRLLGKGNGAGSSIAKEGSGSHDDVLEEHVGGCA